MKIGMIFADENEFAPFANIAEKYSPKREARHGRNSLSFDYDGRKIVALQSGVGKVNAATGAADLIFNEKIDILVNAGLSGAVSGVRRGDVLVGETYIECDFDITPTGRALGEKPDQKYLYLADEALLEKALDIGGVKSAAFGTGDFFLTDKKKGHLYKKLFNIKAFDMESAALASVSHFTHIPFLSIRKMSDNADDGAVSAYREMDEKQEADLSKILFALIDRL